MGPGTDTGSTGWVEYKEDNGYIVLANMNGNPWSLYIADGRNRIYQPNASLAEVEWMYLKHGMNLYYKRQDSNVYIPGEFQGIDYGTGQASMDAPVGSVGAYITDEPRFFYFKDLSNHKAFTTGVKEHKEYNMVCPQCGAQAYQGLSKIECSRGCE